MVGEFNYSLIFHSEEEEKEEQVIVHVQGKQVVPMVKLSRQQLTFGECDVNDNKDILLSIENVHPYLPVEIAFSKISCFFIKPEKLTLPP